MAAVADLWHAAWHVAHSGHVPDGLTRARSLEAVRGRTPARVADTTVAEVDGALAGFIMVDGDGDGVEQLFVDPVGHGSGSRLPCWPRPSGGSPRPGTTSPGCPSWRATPGRTASARSTGGTTRGDLPYEVEVAGTTYVSPCRRYVKRVRG
jgi:putative acetyltransferase